MLLDLIAWWEYWERDVWRAKRPSCQKPVPLSDGARQVSSIFGHSPKAWARKAKLRVKVEIIAPCVQCMEHTQRRLAIPLGTLEKKPVVNGPKRKVWAQSTKDRWASEIVFQ